LLRKAIATENINASILESYIAVNSGYQVGINGEVSSILSVQNTLENTRINNRLAIDNSQSQLDLAQIEYNNADIGLQNAKDGAELQNSAAKSQYDNAAYSYNNLTLAAPFSGTILSHYAKAGEQVSVGQELIELGNISIVEITVDVDVDFAKAIKLNDKVMIDDTYEGIVSEIEPIGDLASGKVSIKVQSQDSEDLVAGNSAEVKFELSYEDVNTVVVPIKSVTIEASGNYVYVVGEGGKVERRNVNLGQIYGDKVSVLSGLEEGDKLILLNGVFVSVGDSVEIINQ
jgi:RND family efflux transporter MFP subunit